MKWRLGVVGSPVAHSLSPQLHEAGLEMAGLDGFSERREINASSSHELLTLMGATYDALSVTMPLKASAAKYCDDLDDVAQRTDVVNSLLYRDGEIHGASTDGPGFLDALSSQLGVHVENMHAVILGSGGAARAIVDALVHANANAVSVHGRNENNVASLRAKYPNVFATMLQYRPVDLIVNTIPAPVRVDEAAVMQGVTSQTVAVDITYEPRVSPWLALHEQSGCATLNGLAMLAYQAARQMNWWWGSALSGAKLLEVIS
jgi:shikimate dehydrogenase